MKERVFAVLVLTALLVFLVARFRQEGAAPAAAPPLKPGTQPSSAATTGQSPPGAPPPPDGIEPIPPPSAASRPEAVSSGVMAGMPMTRTYSNATDPVPMVAPAALVALVIPEARGRAELENVQSMLRDFRTRMGDNPVGSNAEIMLAVMGRNPASARLGPPPGQQLNTEGELLDPWGTPWFFHQLSAVQMEVRSAGPDKIMWSGDDLAGK